MKTLSSLDNVMISPTLILTDVFDVRILLILTHPSRIICWAFALDLIKRHLKSQTSILCSSIV